MSLAALVLSAGLGTRLQPLTGVRAKPAIPVAGEAMIRRIIRWLVQNGVSDIVLNLHHLPQTIAAAVGDGSDLRARVRYSWEQPVLLGSAGGPRQAIPIIDAATFWVMNGDTLTDVDLSAVTESHRQSGALVTMALMPNRQPDRYGGVRLDGDSRVVGFAPRGRAEGSYHFIGVQLVEAAAFAAVPAGQPAPSVGGVYDHLIASRPGSIRGVVCDGAFWDVGTVADYWSTSWAFAEREGRLDVSVGARTQIAPTARVSRSILWDDVEVSREAVIEDCVVTDRVCVPAGACYRQLMLMQGSGGAVHTFPLPR